MASSGLDTLLTPASSHLSWLPKLSQTPTPSLFFAMKESEQYDPAYEQRYTGLECVIRAQKQGWQDVLLSHFWAHRNEK